MFGWIKESAVYEAGLIGSGSWDEESSSYKVQLPAEVLLEAARVMDKGYLFYVHGTIEAEGTESEFYLRANKMEANRILFAEGSTLTEGLLTISYFDLTHVETEVADLMNDVADLKTALTLPNEVMLKTAKRNVQSPTWTSGGVNQSTGSLTTNSKRLRTNAMDGSCDAIEVKSTLPIEIAVYAYLYHAATTGTYVGMVSSFVALGTDGTITIPIDKGLAYIVVVKYVNDTDIDTSAGEDITIQKCFFPKFSLTQESIVEDYTGSRKINGLYFSWERGVISANGNEANNEYVIRTTDYFPISPDVSLKFTGVEQTSIFVCAYDNEKTFITRKELLSGSVVLPGNTAYIRFVYGNTTASGVKVTDGYDLVQAFEIEITVPQQIPSYYFENDYLPSRIDTIISKIKDLSFRSESFIFFSDPHIYRESVATVDNGMQAVKLIKYVKDRTNIQKVVCGGDLTNGTSMTWNQCMDLFSAVMQYFAPIWRDTNFIIGNHEWNNPGNDAEQEVNQTKIGELYNFFLADKEQEYAVVDTQYGSYVIDDKVKKIRTLYLSCNVSSTMRAAQLQWIANVLADTEAGYALIVCSHIGINTTGDGWINQFSEVVAMLDALKQRTSYSLVVSGVSYGSWDYSNSDVDVVGVFCGHIHRDLSMTTPQGIPVISITCDRGPTSTSSEIFNEARAYGTINEQAIDVVQIDITNRKIYTTRIGGSMDDTAPLENPDREFSF